LEKPQSLRAPERVPPERSRDPRRKKKGGKQPKGPNKQSTGSKKPETWRNPKNKGQDSPEGDLPNKKERVNWRKNKAHLK